MNDVDQDIRARDLTIAANEERRERASAIRLSTWAIGTAVLFGLAVVWLALMNG